MELPLELISAYRQFSRVCRFGYSALGIVRPDCRAAAGNPWLFGEANPPGYEAAGRFRFLHTLSVARKLGARRILEVAGSGGLLSACLYREGQRILVNDLRDLSGELRQWTTGDYLQFVAGDLFEIDSEQVGKFDLIIASEVIEHIAHSDQLLIHLRSLLAEGGTLLLTTPNGAYFRSRLPTFAEVADFDSLEGRQFGPDAQDHLFLFTRTELESLLVRCGFQPQRTDFFATPWLSGESGFRYLPKHRFLSPLYLGLDWLTKTIWGNRLGNGLLVLATRV